jgi:hypothetical protein
MPHTKEAVAIAPEQSAGNQDLYAGSREPLLQTRIRTEEDGMLFRAPQQDRVVPPGSPLAEAPFSAPGLTRFRRNKLAFKNRWLISVDVVAALRRAGVVCDIVLPPLYFDTATSTRH